MPNKSCQLDILNTSTLKKVIDVHIPAITREINLSLDGEISVQTGKLLS